MKFNIYTIQKGRDIRRIPEYEDKMLKTYQPFNITSVSSNWFLLNDK